MKLKRQAPSPPTDLLDEFRKTDGMLEDMLQGNGLVLSAAALTDARRHECVEVINDVIARMHTFRRVIETTGQLVAQMRLSGVEERAYIIEDDMHIIITPPIEGQP